MKKGEAQPGDTEGDDDSLHVHDYVNGSCCICGAEFHESPVATPEQAALPNGQPHPIAHVPVLVTKSELFKAAALIQDAIFTVAVILGFGVLALAVLLIHLTTR